MALRAKSRRIEEFGDFQTPQVLAAEVCAFLRSWGTRAAAIVEPTCGTGNFLIAALDAFPEAQVALGLDIDCSLVQQAEAFAAERGYGERVRTVHGDFFETDWSGLLRQLPEPIVVIGNPPWVTSSALGALGSTNLPVKSNPHRLSGLDARTGKSNFDISEWMIIALLEALEGRSATVALLCKTAVARKALLHAWRRNASIAESRIVRIDARAHFGASVSACLFVCRLAPGARSYESPVLGGLGGGTPGPGVALRDDTLIADAAAYERCKDLIGVARIRWRSGIKHDCAKVMEFVRDGRWLKNGLGDVVDIEGDFLYPMLKGTELSKGMVDAPSRWMLVTQRSIGEDTGGIASRAPKTWSYLLSHGARLDRRGSSIYRGRPRFSIFGVGPYSFAPWKVAISGFHKSPQFRKVGPFRGKPVVLDDTCSFLPCETEHDACSLEGMLNSKRARDFLDAFVFWDAKRPITIEVLKRLDIAALEVRSHCGNAEDTGKHSPR